MITTNKVSGSDGIPAKLLQILKDVTVKVLRCYCESAALNIPALKIWKTQQWQQDSVFIPIPEKGNAKECSNYRKIALISHASKVILKILQARL